MAVGAVGDELVAELLELVLECLGVLDHLLLVLLELGGSGLLQGNSQSGDGVVVGTTLVTGEDGEVDGVLEVVQDLLAGLGSVLRTPLRKKIMAPRGPRRDLWVVVVTMSAYSKGEGMTPAAIRPEIWAMSTIRYAPTLSAIWRMRS